MVPHFSLYPLSPAHSRYNKDVGVDPVHVETLISDPLISQDHIT